MRGASAEVEDVSLDARSITADAVAVDAEAGISGTDWGAPASL